MRMDVNRMLSIVQLWRLAIAGYKCFKYEYSFLPAILILIWCLFFFPTSKEISPETVRQVLQQTTVNIR